MWLFHPIATSILYIFNVNHYSLVLHLSHLSFLDYFLQALKKEKKHVLEPGGFLWVFFPLPHPIFLEYRSFLITIDLSGFCRTLYRLYYTGS